MQAYWCKTEPLQEPNIKTLTDAGVQNGLFQANVHNDASDERLIK